MLRVYYLCCNIAIILFTVTNGVECALIMSANPPLSGLICVGKSITLTATYVPNDNTEYLGYQWSIDGNLKSGANTHIYSVQVYSQSINVTCEAFIKFNNNGSVLNESVSITIQPNGTIPQIDFQHGVSPFVSNGRPFNLTATIVSTLNLTSLCWSPPGLDPLPNKTISVHNGSTITTTFMLLKNATLGDSGNYTLTAVNECGQNSSQIYVDVHIDCPLSGLIDVIPVNFTTVEGYHTNIACDFNGYYSASSHLRAWISLPQQKQTPVALNDQPSFGCNCWVEYVLGCASNTQPDHCCNFRFIIHSTPHLNDSDTVFFCTNNHSKENNSQARMFVAPSPKVIEPPRSLSTTVGSKAVFTCDFEATTDKRITQIWWEFNGKYLAGPGQKKFQNYAVTQHSTDTNYISGTLEIYSVQADNAGQYTCYCNYDERALNVNAESQFIRSERKSATLSVQPWYNHADHKKLIIIGGSIGVLIAVITIATIIMVFYRVIVYHRRYWNYIHVPGKDEPLAEITDEILDQYIIEGLLPFWEKLGKALNVPNDFLKGDLPADPTERLKAILREWRAMEDHPSVSTLNRKLEQLGLKDFIPRDL